MVYSPTHRKQRRLAQPGEVYPRIYGWFLAALVLVGTAFLAADIYIKVEALDFGETQTRKLDQLNADVQLLRYQTVVLCGEGSQGYER